MANDRSGNDKPVESGSLSESADAVGKVLFGEEAYNNIDMAVNLTLHGRLLESEALEAKGLLQGFAHIVTAPIRLLDAATCGTGLIHCPPEPVAPKATPTVKGLSTDDKNRGPTA